MTDSKQDFTGEGPPPAPRWVKVSAILAVILLLGVVIVHLAGGGLGNHIRH